MSMGKSSRDNANRGERKLAALDRGLLQERLKEAATVNEKLILDACCGGRMFWFDKQNPLTVFCDNREFSGELCDGRTFEVKPDIIADLTALPFETGSFKLVVFDPPHILRGGDDAWIVKKYGRLPTEWENTLRVGFAECMRVLDDYGVLVFKWCEDQIPVSKIVQVVGVAPLFGHKSGRTGKTHWLCFMKLPEVGGQAQ